MRKSIIGFIGLIGLSAIAAVGVALWKVWGGGTRSQPRDGEWDGAPFPFPPVPRPATAVAAVEPWSQPVDGACPSTHPIKAKLSSGIYHSPGGMNYERTKADRCYLDGAAAERDGLRAAKL